VVEAMAAHLVRESRMGSYEAAESSREAIERAHPAIAELLNCRAGEVAILDSATRAWGTALASIALRPGDRVLTSPVEYGSNHIALLHATGRAGASLEVLPTDEDGVVDVAALAARLDDRVKLVTTAHVPMHDGMVNPVADIGRITRAHGVPYLVDACQSVGQLPVDVEAIGCDLLVGCGRKYLRGPRGTGFLYVRDDLVETLTPPLLGLDGAEWAAGTYRLAPGARRFETWEMNCAARVGLGVAVDYALRWGVEHTWQRVRALAGRLRQDLAGIPGVRVEDRGRERCGSIALTVEGRAAPWVRAGLRRGGVNTWVCLENSACLDMRSREMTSLLRVSLHYYNSPDELARFCSVLESLTSRRDARVLA
jgi:selenocysteine lyase/cysteine desulfurase